MKSSESRNNNHANIENNLRNNFIHVILHVYINRSHVYIGINMRQVQLRDVKAKGLFQLKDVETSTLYVRNHYDKASKSFSISKYEDINAERFIKADRIVFVD